MVVWDEVTLLLYTIPQEVLIIYLPKLQNYCKYITVHTTNIDARS